MGGVKCIGHLSPVKTQSRQMLSPCNVRINLFVQTSNYWEKKISLYRWIVTNMASWGVLVMGCMGLALSTDDSTCFGSTSFIETLNDISIFIDKHHPTLFSGQLHRHKSHNDTLHAGTVSTLDFYDINDLHRSPGVRNCRMPNYNYWAFFIINLISIN